MCCFLNIYFNNTLLFFQPLENKCVLACTASKDLEYNPNNRNDELHEKYIRASLDSNNYTQIAVQDGLKCSDNGVRTVLILCF